MEFLEDFFVLIGRVLISALFLWGAYERAAHWNAAVSRLKSKHVPQVNIVLPVTVGLKAVGGILVLLGWHSHIGALLLLIAAIPSVIWLHAFWQIPHGPEHRLEKNLFMKEVAIIGGLFLILALGAGHFAFGGG